MTPHIPTHIRRPDAKELSQVLCDEPNGSSISAFHYREQPAHVATLSICRKCLLVAKLPRFKVTFGPPPREVLQLEDRKS